VSRRLLRCREDIKKPRPQDAAEEAIVIELGARILPLISPHFIARQELAPYLNRSWEQCRGCQDFTGPEPSVLLDEHNVKVQISLAIDAGRFSDGNNRDRNGTVQIDAHIVVPSCHFLLSMTAPVLDNRPF